MTEKTSKIFQPNINANDEDTAALYRGMGLNANDQAEPLAVLPPVDDDAAGREAVREKMTDALTPGFQVEFDPDEAERVGAFVEDALSEQDAAASGDDLVEVDGALEPAFLDDEGPSADLPPFITTTNARELYSPRPGETVAQAAARKASGG